MDGWGREELVARFLFSPPEGAEHCNICLSINGASQLDENFCALNEARVVFFHVYEIHESARKSFLSRFYLHVSLYFVRLSVS